MPVRKRSNEGGAVLITVAVGTVALIAAAALAVDLGSTLVERRHARNAADHAALAAAWADCNGDIPLNAANASVIRNDYETSELTLSPTTDGWQAVIATTVDMTFASVVGFDSVGVTGEAEAECGGGSNFTGAILAFGTGCFPAEGDQILWGGSNAEVWGGLHSNDNIEISGSSGDFGVGNGNPPLDTVTYSGFNDPDGDPAFYDQGSDNSFDVAPFWVPSQSDPGLFTLSDYDTGGRYALEAGGDYHRIVGKITIDDIAGPGLYYAASGGGEQGDIDIGSAITGAYTFVAEGTIKIQASDSNVTPYTSDNLLMWGAHEPSEISVKCQSSVVEVSGQASQWTGLIYGAGGQLRFNGSQSASLSGSLLGFGVSVSGQNFTIHSDASLFPPPGSPRLIK